MLAQITPPSTSTIVCREIVTPWPKWPENEPSLVVACRHAIAEITAYVNATPTQYGASSLRKRAKKNRGQLSPSPARYAAMVSDTPLIIMKSGTPWKPSRNSRSVSDVKIAHGPLPCFTCHMSCS